MPAGTGRALPISGTSSPAQIALAMRNLLRRVQALEDENARLKERVQALESAP